MMMRTVIPCMHWILLAACLPNMVFSAQQESRSLLLLREQYEARHKEFAAQMLQLADYCAANSFFTDADKIRLRASRGDEQKLDLDELPQFVLPPLPKQMGAAELQWRTKLKALEENYAQSLYIFARRAMQAGHASLAYQLVQELVFHDPDHKAGRELLGYVHYEGEWTTPFSRTMRSRGFVDHPLYGWIPKINIARYEQGERLFNGRWISVEREATQRKAFRDSWEIETEHFFIKTNHSLEKGVEISRQLETFHRFFLREFAAFFSSPQQMQNLFGGGAVTKGTQQDRHRVYYFVNREEFADALQAKNQTVTIATGFYLPQERTSFFYYDADPENAEPNQETMFHEVTHQILGESSRKNLDVGEHNNFWVIEGIACYMESIELSARAATTEQTSTEARTSIGDSTHPRIYWAKQKATVDSFYLPMQRFMLYSKKQFQTPPDNETLHAYYSQATGLVHFFLHYEQGVYRDAFIEYLSQVYSPNDRTRLRPKTLEELTEVPFSTLDQQYLSYLKTLKTF